MQAEPTAPPWPSLYNFLIEVDFIPGRDPIQPGGHYLYNAKGQSVRQLQITRSIISTVISIDIYRFTLYWTFLFYTPAFLFCGLYAFLNLTFTQHSRVRHFLFLAPAKYAAVPTTGELPLRPLRNALSPEPRNDRHAPGARRARTRHNERRSRLTFSIIVAFTFAVTAIGGAVIGSAITGYIMAGLFSAASFNMST